MNGPTTRPVEERKFQMLKFTEEHDWVNIDGDIATIGITEHAAEELGDLVFVELPKLGTKLAKGDTAAVVESVKTAYDIASPVGGEVVEINQSAADDPAIVSAEPLGNGWIYKIKLSNPSEVEGLMDETAYKASLA
jgi:glycine cleavage system H protein